jgi:RNA polymerase sigma-70 factor (ECF subfamily)
MSTKDEVQAALQAAYQAAYLANSDYVFGVCLKFAGGDRSWALDRAHDVFMRLHQNLPELDLNDELRPWLRKVAVNECLLELRRSERRKRLLALFGLALEPSASNLERSSALGRDVVELDRALGTLPAKQRMLLGLMYFEGESLTSAAELIGVSKGQASKLHKRALATLAAREWESQP